MKIIFLTIKCVLLISLQDVVSYKSSSPKQITAREVLIRVNENKAKLLQDLHVAESKSSGIKNPQTKEEMAKRYQNLEKEVTLESQDILNEVLRICRNSDTFHSDSTICKQDPTTKITDKFGPLFLRVDKYAKDVQLQLDDQSKISEPYKNKFPDRMIG